VKNKREDFETKDIYLSAIFIALGGFYSHADKSDPRHQIFYFRDNGNVNFDEVVSEYVMGTLVINAAAFKESIQRMKSVIHSY